MENKILSTEIYRVLFGLIFCSLIATEAILLTRLESVPGTNQSSFLLMETRSLLGLELMSDMMQSTYYLSDA